LIAETSDWRLAKKHRIAEKQKAVYLAMFIKSKVVKGYPINET